MRVLLRAAISLAVSLASLTAWTQTSVLLDKNESSSLPASDSSQSTTQDTSASNDEPTTMWPHSDSSRYWISGQSNTIFQAHPAFHARYTGVNSLLPRGEYKVSLVETLFTALQASKNTDLILDIESAGGRGISQAFGLAGFTDLDVVRNPTLGAAPYIARVMLHQTVPLSKSTTQATRGPFSLATQVPIRRLEFRVGKFGTADFFDQNSAGSDSHLQFLNWTIDNNGAYDYAADTRGYTWAADIEYHDRWGTLRFAEALMPKVANGIKLDWDLLRARAENVEVEIHPSIWHAHPTIFRFLGYANTADMGNYRQAINNFLSGATTVPDVIATRQQGRVKYGFGVNLEQPLNSWITAFARWGWNEGTNESFAYTEVNLTALAGAAATGDRWHRKLDHAGVAFVSNGISRDHQQYLALGGVGFLLGDGALNYGRENIFETFYTAHVWRGLFASFDLQHINNPGYNRDRGPVLVPGLRAHVEF